MSNDSNLSVASHNSLRFLRPKQIVRQGPNLSAVKHQQWRYFCLKRKISIAGLILAERFELCCIYRDGNRPNKRVVNLNNKLICLYLFIKNNESVLTNSIIIQIRFRLRPYSGGLHRYIDRVSLSMG